MIGLLFGRDTDNFEDAGLPETAYSLLASVDGSPIHCVSIDEVEPCLQGTRIRDLDSQVVWLGNSQLHAINHYKPGQGNGPLILFHYLASKSADLITVSPPNANLQEHYAVFEYLRSRIPIDYLILPVVFDDTREDGVRASISMALEDKQSVSSLSRTEPGRRLLGNSGKGADGNSDLAGLKTTLQENAEIFLNGWLEEHWRIWQLRPQARGRIVEQLHYLRNIVFRITAQTKRPKILGRYMKNMEALEAILSVADNASIRVLVYIAPLRDDVEVPYFQDEYTQFKKEVEQLADTHHANFENYETLIPAELWGMKESTRGDEQMELDFMHFQAGGHEILASELAAFLDQHFLASLHQIPGE